ncbi:hypothetical protein AB0C60_01910, partial [Streptomyces sp. NPDC048845]
MSIRYTAKVRRGAAAAALAAGLLVAVAGCGGDDGTPEKKSSTQTEGVEQDSGKDREESKDTEPGQVLAEVKGQGKVSLVINSVERDAGGFVTVNGVVKNSGDKAYFDTPQWRGNEQE